LTPRPELENAIMRRARPYCGENPEPGKDVTESLTPRPELENDQDPKRTFFSLCNELGRLASVGMELSRRSRKRSNRPEGA
jgi:hypothetical protein